VQVENPSLENLDEQFKPMDGFGGNPLDNGNYWMMTKGMFERGLRHGVINEFNMLDNIVKDFDSVWTEYKRIPFGKGWVDVHHEAHKNNGFAQSLEMAEKEAMLGNQIKILPEHTGKGIKKWKNPDYLYNASLYELKTIEGSKSSISNALSGKKKQSPNFIIAVPANANKTMLLRYINGRLKDKKQPLNIRKIILYIGGERFVFP
jgi:antitoxin component HigA of HigAB toxin-antitoxin module